MERNGALLTLNNLAPDLKMFKKYKQLRVEKDCLENDDINNL